MAKKPAVSEKKSSTPVKKSSVPAKKPATDKKDEIPADVLAKIKIIQRKYFKDDSLAEVKKIYLEEYNEQKEKHKDQNWHDNIFHKRSISALKNRKKREKLGGTVDKYYGVVFGFSKTRDLSATKRGEIVKKWEDEPDEAMREGLIMTRKEKNPKSGEIEQTPIYDKDGGIIPRDNREFFERTDGSKFKNPNFDKALAKAYRKSVLGVCSNLSGLTGAFIMELRDSACDLEIPMNQIIKFSGRTLETASIIMDNNKFIEKDLLEEMKENLQFDIEQGIITKIYAKSIEEHYNKLLNGEAIETTLFKLRSSRGSYFSLLENEKELEESGLKDVDINLLYKEHFYPFTSDCSNLLEFHEDNRYVKDSNGAKTDDINWDEFVCLQDVNVIQMNTEASMSGNYTLYVEDDSLFNKDVSHLGNEIDSIRLLVPSHIELDFGQDSKVNVVGAPAQFQAQDEENKAMFEEIVSDDGKKQKVPILAFPMVMVYGIYAIPQYKVEVETIDMTHEDEPEVEIGEEVDELDLSDEELEDMEKAVSKVKDAEENGEEVEETDEDAEEVIKDEDVDEEPELW